MTEPATLQFTNGSILLEDPQTMRFVLAPSGKVGDTSACIHLLRLQDTPGAKGLDGEARLDAHAHVCTVWSGPRDIALDLCSRLAFALAHPVPLAYDVAELEAMCIKTRDRLKRDLDEDLRTGRDAATTEDDAEAATLAQDLRTSATEVRALSTTHTEAIGEAATLIETIAGAVGLGAGRELTAAAKTLREIAAYTAEGQDSIAKALDESATMLETDTP